MEMEIIVLEELTWHFNISMFHAHTMVEIWIRGHYKGRIVPVEVLKV